MTFKCQIQGRISLFKGIRKSEITSFTFEAYIDHVQLSACVLSVET